MTYRPPTLAGLSTLEGVGPKARAAREETSSAIQALTADTSRNADWVKAQSGFLREALDKTVIALQADAESARESLVDADQLKDVRSAADLQRQASAWGLVKDQLAAGLAWQHVVSDAADAGDADTLAAIADSLPSRLIAEQGNSSSDSALFRRDRVREIRQMVKDALDPALVAAGSGTHRDAASIRLRVAAADTYARAELNDAAVVAQGGRVNALEAALRDHYAKAQA